jgi:hypothetical protein
LPFSALRREDSLWWFAGTKAVVKRTNVRECYLFDGVFIIATPSGGDGVIGDVKHKIPIEELKLSASDDSKDLTFEVTCADVRLPTRA